MYLVGKDVERAFIPASLSLVKHVSFPEPLVPLLFTDESQEYGLCEIRAMRDKMSMESMTTKASNP